MTWQCGLATQAQDGNIPMKRETETAYFEKISDYLFRHAAERPGHEALVGQEQRLDYLEFSRRVELLSRSLLASGIGYGDRVAFLGPACPEFMIVMMAPVDIGAVWLGLHPRYRIPEFRHVAATATPGIVFAFGNIDGRCYREELLTLRQEFPCIREIVLLDESAASEAGVGYASFMDEYSEECTPDWIGDAREFVTADDAAVIIFTSGTTGAPKGAMISHHGLVHCAHVERSRWPDRDMRMLQNMPINHIANIGMMSSMAMVCGGTLVFQGRFDPEELLDIMQRERITFWLQSPVQFHMVTALKRFSSADLPSLRYIIWGGGPMPEHVVAKLRTLDATVATAYGMTELGCYVTYSDLDEETGILAQVIGKPEPRYDLRVMMDDGRTASAGESGEIQARGDWLMIGYYNQPDETEKAFTHDGWFRTGDVARIRRDGNWQLVGRLKEMYKSGGYNIYPREIEIVIEAHPAVALTAVLGVPDPLYGEVGQAFVETVPGISLSEQDIRRWCRDRLANYKVPKRFWFPDVLPKLPVGKIDRQQLRRSLAGLNMSTPDGTAS